MRSGRPGQLRQRQIIILKYPAVDRRQNPEEIPPAPCPLQLLSAVISCYQLLRNQFISYSCYYICIDAGIIVLLQQLIIYSSSVITSFL
jgi:hypothetical protein